MSIDNRFPNGVPVSFHTDHRCAWDKVTVEKLPDLEAAFSRTAEVLNKGGAVYCARIWEGGVPLRTLYWNGATVFQCDAAGMLSREQAASFRLDERAEIFYPVEEAERKGITW